MGSLFNCSLSLEVYTPLIHVHIDTVTGKNGKLFTDKL